MKRAINNQVKIQDTQYVEPLHARYQFIYILSQTYYISALKYTRNGYRRTTIGA